MKKIISLLFIGGMFTFNALAQDAPSTTENKDWKYDAVGTLQFTQLGLSNWAAGGEDALSLTGFVKANANYAKDGVEWENFAHLGYGLIKQGSRDFVKSDDKLEINSLYKRKAKGNWSYATLLNFKSQFDLGYNDPNARDTVVSQFMAPGFLELSVGMDYKPKDNFSIYLSPIAMKAIYVLAEQVDETRYGLDLGDKSRYELGAKMEMKYKTKLMDNISFETLFGLYSNYLDNPQNIDVKWNNAIVMQVNKYISMNLSTELLYDDNTVFLKDNGKVGKAVQFREVLGLALTYKLL
ncbi:MAG: DUF3078 domain-containing protein [Flavobacteriales bacterium]